MALTPEAREQLDRFANRHNIPPALMAALVNVLLASPTNTALDAVLLPIIAIVEATVQRGADKFTISSFTQWHFDEFLKQRPDFPYQRTYDQITFRRNAHTGGSGTGMTFADRLNLGWRPKQTVGDLTAIFHEYVHTFQYRAWGLPTFMKLYIGNYVGNLVAHPTAAYMEVDFEQQSYHWEGEFRTWATALHTPKGAGAHRHTRPLDPALDA